MISNLIMKRWGTTNWLVTNSSPHRIELGTASQIARIQAVEVQAGELFRGIGMEEIADAEPPSAASIQTHIDAGTLWVAIVDEVVVGYLTASSLDGEGHIDQVSVTPQMSGRGIGTELISEACRWASANGFSSISLTTFAEVPWNGLLYGRRGFVEVEQADLSAELARIRAQETAEGLDIAPRIVMRRML